MRQPQQNKRMRGRSRKPSNSGNRSLESNGPDVKIRGNASHIAEKYVTLARDAQVAGDRIVAENYLQHAEHYFRIVAATQPQQSQQVQAPQPNVGRSGNENETNGNADQLNKVDTTERETSGSQIDHVSEGETRSDKESGARPSKPRTRRRRNPDPVAVSDQSDAGKSAVVNDVKADDVATDKTPNSENGSGEIVTTEIAKAEPAVEIKADESAGIGAAVTEDNVELKPAADSDESVELA